MSDDRSPIARMIDAADLRCTVCGARRGGCDCWTQCQCGWSFRKEGKCRNPKHGGGAGTLEIVASR